MSSPTLTACVTLAAFAATAGLAGVLLRVRPPSVSERLTAASRARLLLALTTGPAILGLAIAFGVALPAFVRFEPAHTGEPHGALLPLLAVAGAVMLGTILWRGARMLFASRLLVARWARSGAPLTDARWGMPATAIDAGFPVVAIAGIFHPRLFIDRGVLAACSPRELDAIAAHERAHLHRGDNLRRLVIGACAGAASARAAAWRQASEEVADDRAAASPHGAVELASALLKISRLAPAGSIDEAALSTIHDGGCLETRVRKLLATRDSSPPASPISAAWMPLLPVVFVALAWNDSLLRSVHAGLELLVRHLP